VLTLPVAFFRKFTSGDLVTRVMSVRAIRQALGVATLRAIVTGLLSFANIALLFYYSGSMALLAILVSLLSSAATLALGFKVMQRSTALDALSGESFGLVVELINGIAKIRVSGAEQRAFRQWTRRSSRQLRLRLESQVFRDQLTLFNTVLSPLSLAVLFIVGASLLLRPAGEPAALSTGAFLAFSSAYGAFLAGMSAVSNAALSVFEAKVHWARAKPILDATPEVDSSKADPGRLSGRVELEGVSFRYREDGPMTLNDVSLRVMPGECVALVGPSGSGKSTVFRALLGFEPIRRGRILYDGQDLTGLNVEAVRRQLGVVLQNGKINAGTLLENIAGARELSLDDAWQAARDAGLEEDIKATMPMGMHTMISEGGTNLSGGQRQRLLIARALALKPAILLFDEATSALDNKTQDLVTQCLERMKITRILIAHRLSTIRRADRIYVIDEGRVVQSGTFDELTKGPGLVRDFVRAGDGATTRAIDGA
jgi:NHLM bacteriocin system ABC transporter ATP-binding protein